MKIVIIGIGYVGLSNAIVFMKSNQVSLVDTNLDKVNTINEKRSPIENKEYDKLIKKYKKNISATNNLTVALADADLVLVAVPTPLDNKTNRLDTTVVEEVINNVTSINSNVNIAIRSTLPIGTTRSLREKYKSNNIVYLPEFLREKTALQDLYNPFRIVIGIDKKCKKSIQIAHVLGNLLISSSTATHRKICIMGLEEAEAVKLYSNAYLATRLTFFNELDKYASEHELNTKDIIDAICLDPRIGDTYNIPNKDGFGGKCLPKDVTDLSTETNSALLRSVVKSNNKK